LAVKLIDVALSDFEASKTLFERKLYSQALFMFQQSLEKAIKAVLLKLGLADVGELRSKLSHTVISGGLELIASRCILQTLVRVDTILRALEVLEKRVGSDRRETVVRARDEVERIFTEVLRDSALFISVFESYRENKNKRNKMSSLLNGLRSLMLKELDDEGRKRVGDLAVKVRVPLSAAMLPESVLEAVYAIERTLTKYFTNPSPELLEELRKLEMDYALTSLIFELMYWYAPFERLASRLRYPSYAESGGDLWTPLAIDENTGIVEWYKDVSDLIEKRKLFICIKEFIKERAETRECAEMLESIRDYVNSILEARQRRGQPSDSNPFYEKKSMG